MVDDTSTQGAAAGDRQRSTEDRRAATADASNGETAASRRTVLRAASTAVVGGAALGATTGTVAAGSKGCGAENAEAPDDFARVTTRDHFDEDANLINGETEWSYQVEGSWPNWGQQELTLFVHGWRSDDSKDEPIDAGQECENALRAEGYGGSVAVYSWDSDKGDSIDLGWASAKDIAERNGKKLANFLQWYSNEYDVDVRLIAHSLGARVVMYALQTLEEAYGEQSLLPSVTLVGGAIEKDSPSMDAGLWDEEFGDHIEYAVGQLDNFHSYDDGILNNIFRLRETEEAAGEVGIQYEAFNLKLKSKIISTGKAQMAVWRRRQISSTLCESASTRSRGRRSPRQTPSGCWSSATNSDSVGPNTRTTGTASSCGTARGWPNTSAV
jgi:pimeloyl-ACP methyl ester carboxylesterase